MTRPGILRFLLDYYVPVLHNALTRHGTLSRPPEFDDLNLYLRNLHSNIEHEIRSKTYIPLTGREVPSSTLAESEGKDPFVKPIHQIIRQLVGISHGGDSASAQIAAVNRKSRIVKNILATLLRADEPLILLGDPGTGKTMTLKQTAMALAEGESRRVFPVVTVYVRLGEFCVEGEVGPAEVADYVRRSAPETIRPYLAALERAGQRLVILFDGMDEMSRERYTEHTEALSRFAGGREGVTKTLFSCRITDFSPKFIHQRLVLLPFNRAQIAEFLEKYINSFPLTIAGESWTLKRLARHLAAGGLPMEANNPFVLWLLCIYLQERKTWPSSRVELLEFFNKLNYERKAAEVRKGEPAFPAPEVAFTGWAGLAYTITTLNRGAAVSLDALKAERQDRYSNLEELTRVGQRCGVLVEAADGDDLLLRFEHHRFQEYFTALHIHKERPQMSWLDKLDTPRWQETMLNLILMGGADDAIQSLASGIIDPIRPYKARLKRKRKSDEAENLSTLWQNLRKPKSELSLTEDEKAATSRPDASEGFEDEEDYQDIEDLEDDSPAQLTEEQETVTADRVELASRILRQVGSGSSVVRAGLLSPFKEAIEFLSEEGNPITQVKVLRACQIVPDVDFTGVLKRSLESPINWVRNQALAVVASSDRGSQAAGSNFGAEMAFDLANGLFPVRIAGYVKAVLASPSKGNWWYLATGILSYLLNVLLLLGMGALFYYAAARGFAEHRAGPYFADPMYAAGYAAVVLLAVLLAFKFRPSLLWAAALGSSALGVLLLPLILAGWNISLGELISLILTTFVSFRYIAPGIGALIGFAMQSVSLLLFLALNSRVRRSGYSKGAFLRAAWQGGQFDDCFGDPFVLMRVAVWSISIGVGFLLLVFLYHYVLKALLLRLNEILGLTFHPLITLGFLVVLLAVVFTLVVSLVNWKVKPYLSIWGFVLLVVLWLGLSAGMNFLISNLDTWLSALFGPEAGRFVVRILLILILLALISALVYALYLIARMVMKWVSWNMRPLPPGSISPEEWRAKLKDFNPEQQHILLLRTNYQSLGMKADEYLEFLKGVSSLINSEPALSTYWSQRAQLEQVLKQERVG